MKIKDLIKELGYKPFGWYNNFGQVTATIYCCTEKELLKQLSLLIVEKLDMKIISLIEAKELINSLFCYTIPIEGTIIFTNERWSGL